MVSHVGQEMRYWCWAASAQMIMARWNVSVAQKQQLFDEYHDPKCLAKAVDESCDLTGWPQFKLYGFDFTPTDTLKDQSWLSWEVIKQQIDSDMPFAFSHRAPDGYKGGHMMVAVGYVDFGGERDVVYNEPLRNGDTFYFSYKRYIGLPRVHWEDFYNIHPH